MYIISQQYGEGKRYWQSYGPGGDLFVWPVHKAHARRFDTREEAEAEAQYIAGAEVEQA